MISITLYPYIIRKGKASNTQVLNIGLFCELIQIKDIPATRNVLDSMSNYDLVVYNISPLVLKWVDIPKSPILCILATLQDMVQAAINSFFDSNITYGGYT